LPIHPISARKVVAVHLLTPSIDIMILKSSSIDDLQYSVRILVSSSWRSCKCCSVLTLPCSISSFAGLHTLPLTRQSEILELSRSSLYYEAVPTSARDLELMRLIDEIHLKHPFMGSRSIRDQLEDMGHKVGREHVGTLLKKMGIAALYRKPRLSKPHPHHKVYPYRLRGMEITRANHVWAADISYLPMARGFCYLVAIMDWASRKVLAWRLSNTPDASFCTEALEEALAKYGTPEIFNTDQGSQFTSEGFIEKLNTHGIQISMDGKGRWMDNGAPQAHKGRPRLRTGLCKAA
jgi:putative transposase